MLRSTCVSILHNQQSLPKSFHVRKEMAVYVRNKSNSRGITLMEEALITTYDITILASSRKINYFMVIYLCLAWEEHLRIKPF